MYIYKITDTLTDKCYIGIDTKPKKKLSRWKAHKRNARYKQKNNLPTTFFYKQLALRESDFVIDVIYEGTTSVYELFLKEIHYIKKYNSYVDGYNGTSGGDGFKRNIKSDKHYEKLYEVFKERMSEFNRKKWTGKTKEQRNLELKWHSEESRLKRSDTIRKEWQEMSPVDKEAKLKNLKEYIKTNHDSYVLKAKKASDIAKERNQHNVTIKCRTTGKMYTFDSIRTADKELKTSILYLRKLKKDGKIGSKKWELINEQQT